MQMINQLFIYRAYLPARTRGIDKSPKTKPSLFEHKLEKSMLNVFRPIIGEWTMNHPLGPAGNQFILNWLNNTNEIDL